MNAKVAKSTAAITFAAVLAAYSVLADAGNRNDSADQRTAVVRYGELDLSKPQGIEALYARIEGAARRVCRDDFSLYDRYVRRHSNCYQDAVERAVRQVNLVKLTALHRARTGSKFG